MKIALTFGDLHIPYVAKGVCDIIFQISKDYKFDEIIYSGDMVDASQLSTKFVNTETYQISLNEEMEMFEDFTKRLRKISPKSKYIMLKDNHFDKRLELYLAMNPALDGMIKEYDFGIHETSEYNVPYFPFGQRKLGMIHGDICSDNFSKALTTMYTHDIITFHTHTSQQYTNKNGVTAYGIGCTCKLNMAYRHNAPTRWKNEIAVITYCERTNQYNIERIPINNGKAFFRGKVYGI